MRDILADLRDRRLHRLADRHFRIANRRLIEQADLLVEAVQLALDDLLDDLRRLVLALHLAAIDAALALEHVGRHLFPPHVLRAGRGNVHGDLARKALEVLRPRHEVGLAVHLDQDANLAAHVDVAADQPFVGRAAGFLRRLREPALAEDGRRFLHVAVRFGERGLALHHARAGQIAELFHHRSSNFHSCLRRRHVHAFS